MSEIGKIELDDDVLDKVSGGATQNTGCDCSSCIRIDPSKPKGCDNCGNNMGGYCPVKGTIV